MKRLKNEEKIETLKKAIKQKKNSLQKIITLKEINQITFKFINLLYNCPIISFSF